MLCIGTKRNIWQRVIEQYPHTVYTRNNEAAMNEAARIFNMADVDYAAIPFLEGSTGWGLMTREQVPTLQKLFGKVYDSEPPMEYFQ